MPPSPKISKSWDSGKTHNDPGTPSGTDRRWRVARCLATLILNHTCFGLRNPTLAAPRPATRRSCATERPLASPPPTSASAASSRSSRNRWCCSTWKGKGESPVGKPRSCANWAHTRQPAYSTAWFRAANWSGEAHAAALFTSGNHKL